MSARVKPSNGDKCRWDMFEQYCQLHGIGDMAGDWERWWNCWQVAYVNGVADQLDTDAA